MKFQYFLVMGSSQYQYREEMLVLCTELDSISMFVSSTFYWIANIFFLLMFSLANFLKLVSLEFFLLTT